MLDQGRWCRCSACRAEGPPTHRVLDVAEAGPGAVAAARADGRLGRPVEVATLAFFETDPAPTRGTPEPAFDAGVTVTPGELPSPRSARVLLHARAHSRVGIVGPAA